MKDVLDKQQVILAVLKELEKKKLELGKSVEGFKKSASESSKSTESWSDSSRTQFNMMGGAIQKEVFVIESAINFLKTVGVKSINVAEIGSLVEVKENKQSKFYFLVPEGSGGFVANVSGHDVLVLAETSPLGNALVGKKSGDSVIFRDKIFEIVKVS